MLTQPRPVRVAVMCSRRAPGLVHLLERDPNRGRAYDIVCVLTTEHTFVERPTVEGFGVPTLEHGIRDFYARRREAIGRDFETRRFFDRETVDRLTPYSPDLVVLDGYLYLVTRPMLDAFAGRLINLHFSDLTIRRPDGRPRYPGMRAVRDALLDGQSETTATVHLVNDVADGGAPLVCSWPYPVSALAGAARAWDAVDMFKAYVFAHQEWMVRSASGPLLAAALALIAEGRIDLEALAAADPAAVAPWVVDERGRLTPPGTLETCRRLWRYQRAG